MQILHSMHMYKKSANFSKHITMKFELIKIMLLLIGFKIVYIVFYISVMYAYIHSYVK
jgi:hypothetical protein